MAADTRYYYVSIHMRRTIICVPVSSLLGLLSVTPSLQSRALTPVFRSTKHSEKENIVRKAVAVE